MKKILDKPEKVRTSLEELEVLSKLKDSVEWVIVKRMAGRYIQNLRKASFKLIETNPNYLAVRHAEFAGQALGIKSLIRLVDESGRRHEKLENKKK
jgi:hypothetical protein